MNEMIYYVNMASTASASVRVDPSPWQRHSPAEKPTGF